MATPIAAQWLVYYFVQQEAVYCVARERIHERIKTMMSKALAPRVILLKTYIHCTYIRSYMYSRHLRYIYTSTGDANRPKERHAGGHSVFDELRQSAWMIVICRILSPTPSSLIPA